MTQGVNPPVGFPQSCPTLSLGFSRFASTKQPLVTSGSRPQAVLQCHSGPDSCAPVVSRHAGVAVEGVRAGRVANDSLMSY